MNLESEYAGTALHGRYELAVRGSVNSGRCYRSSEERDATFAQLRALGITVVWDLLEVEGVYVGTFAAEAAAFTLVHTPLEDLGLPVDLDAFRADLERVRSHLESGAGVFVHCAAGHGRTGLALAALTARVEGVTADAALARARAHCHGPETQPQEQLVRDLAARWSRERHLQG